MKSLLTIGLLSLFVSGALVACNKKSDSSTPIAGTPIYGNGINSGCAGCNFAPGQLFTGTSQSSEVTIQWQLMGDQNVMAQTAQMNAMYGGYQTDIWKTYSGPVAVTGVMNIQGSQGQPLYFGNCLVYPGQYQIQSMAPGQMSGGSVQLPQFQAVGPSGQLVLSLSNAVIQAYGGSGGPGIFGALMILQGPSYNMYQGGYPTGYPNQGYPMGGITSCGGGSPIYVQ
jgi:hypothetical protein